MSVLSVRLTTIYDIKMMNTHLSSCKIVQLGVIHLPRVWGHGHRAGGGGHRGLPPRLEWNLERVKTLSEGERQAPGGDPRHPRLGGGQRRRGGY